MPFVIREEIENYALDHSVPESPLLKALVEDTYAKTDFPQMQIGHLEGSFLRMLVRLLGANRILEIGTFTGYSALCMAEALPDTGELITCDKDPEATAMAKAYWERSKHGSKIKLVLGPALEALSNLDGSFDMAFIDADKENYIAYWDEVIPKLRQGGLVVADNVLWSGRVLQPKEKSDKAIHAFNEHVLKDDRVESVMLTVRDGMTLARKK